MQLLGLLHSLARDGLRPIRIALLGGLVLFEPAAQAATSGTAEASVEATPKCGVPAAPCEGRFRLGLGTGLLMRFTEATQSSGDIGEAGVGALFDLSVAPAYRVWDDLTLGLRLGWAPELGSRGEASSSGAFTPFGRTLWHAAAEARYQPPSAQGVYLVAHGGVAAMVDRVGDDAITQWGPLLGAAIGCEWRLARYASLGLELQAGYAGFSDKGARLVHEGQATLYQYGSTGWLGLSLIGALNL